MVIKRYMLGCTGFQDAWIKWSLESLFVSVSICFRWKSTTLTEINNRWDIHQRYFYGCYTKLNTDSRNLYRYLGVFERRNACRIVLPVLAIKIPVVTLISRLTFVSSARESLFSSKLHNGASITFMSATTYMGGGFEKLKRSKKCDFPMRSFGVRRKQ